MVRRLFQFFHQEFSGVHQAAFILALSGIVADILALFRDRLLASAFGAGRVLDVYFASFRIPDFIYTLTLLIAASTALVPMILKKFSEDEGGAQRFVGGVFVVFFAVTAVLSGATFFIMPLLVGLVAPGFSGADKDSVILLSRILLLSPVLLGLSNLVSSVIQSFRRFFIYALSPVFYNVGIIIGIMFFYPLWGAAGLAWGVAFGALLHLLVQLPSVARLGFKPRFDLWGIGRDLREVVKLSFPRTIGLSLNQAVIMVMTALASKFGVGSIAVFNFAQNLQSVPLSVIGLSYSVAAFPTMARLFVDNKREEFLSSVSVAFRHIIFWSLPITALFIVLRAQIVRVILGAGAFGWADTRLTAAALLLLSVSVISQGLIMLFVRAFYAAGHTILPLAVNFLASVVAIVASFALAGVFQVSVPFREFFEYILRVGDVPGSIMLVLPLAFSLGSLINAVLLMVYFDRIFGKLTFRSFYRSFLEITFASVALSVVSYFGLQILDDMLDVHTFLGIFLQGFFAGIAGLSAVIFIFWFVRNKEFIEIIAVLKHRLYGAEVISQEPEKLI